jgi:threonine efflux protein
MTASASDLAILPAVFAVHVAAMITPGPNVLVVTRTAATTARRLALLTALGVTAGAVIWSVGAAVGLQAIFENVPIAPRLVQLAGGAYIVWIGIRLWLSTFRSNADSRVKEAAPNTATSAFRLGLLTNLSNPKSLVFYGSVFATLLGPNPSTTLRIAAVSLLIADAFVWHMGLATVFSTPPVRSGYLLIQTAVDRIAGAILLVIGSSLIATDLLRR